MVVMINRRPATGLQLTQTVGIKTATGLDLWQKPGGRPVADPWFKGGYFCKEIYSSAGLVEPEIQ